MKTLTQDIRMSHGTSAPLARLARSASVAALLIAGSATASAAQALVCDLSGFRESTGIRASTTSQGIALEWRGADAEEVQLRLTRSGGTPVIERLAVRHGQGQWLTVAQNARVEYQIVEGWRRISNQQLSPLRSLGVELTQEI